MEPNGGGMNNNTVRKKRSLTCRRPRLDGSTPSDNLSKISSDDIPAFDTNPTRKEFSLSHCISRADSIAESQRGNNAPTLRREINKRSTEAVLSPASRQDEGNGRINGKATALGGETKKMKLKISGGGVSRLVHANGSSRKPSKPVNHTTNNEYREVKYLTMIYIDRAQVVVLQSINIYILLPDHHFALSFFFGKCFGQPQKRVYHSPKTMFFDSVETVGSC